MTQPLSETSESNTTEVNSQIQNRAGYPQIEEVFVAKLQSSKSLATVLKAINFSDVILNLNFRLALLQLHPKE